MLYGYDNQGRLQSVSQVRLVDETTGAAAYVDSGGDAVAATYPQTLYTYDGDGNLKSVSDPNGMVTGYTYDDLNRLTGEIVTQTTSGISRDVFREALTLNSDGTHASETDTRYDDTGALYDQTLMSWTYDNEDRLVEEKLAVLQNPANDAPAAYADTFQYDRDGNRVGEYAYDGTGTLLYGIGYNYNDDDQLIDENDGETKSSDTYTYDAEGNLVSDDQGGLASGDTPTTYTYDLQNHMTSESTTTNPGNSNYYTRTGTTYGYDTSGVLTWEQTQPAETTGTTEAVTYYLNDPNNPTGYTKAIELKTGTTTANAMISRSYVLGLKIEAQTGLGTDANGRPIAVPLYFLTDGHGSTRSLVTAAGKQQEEYDYTAFGDLTRGVHYATAINGTVTTTTITEAAAETSWFASDGWYDVASGLTNHDARWTDGFWFTQSDFGGYGRTSSPLTLNKYLYADGDPVDNLDANGHEVEQLAVAGLIIGIIAINIGAVGLLGYFAANPVSQGLQPQLPQGLSGTTVHYHSVIIASSSKTADQTFAEVASLSDLPAESITSSGNPAGKGDITSFALHGFPESVSNSFSVQTVRFDPGQRILVVQTLAGHPLSGWRGWQVSELPGKKLLVETWSVDEPEDVNAFTNAEAQVAYYGMGGQNAQQQTWTKFLSNVVQSTGGTADGGDINGSSNENSGEFFARYGIGSPPM